MATLTQALFAHPVSSKKAKAVRVRSYIRTSTATKARAAKAVQVELAERASTSNDFAGMVRVDGNMTRTQALAAVLRISLEEAALL